MNLSVDKSPLFDSDVTGQFSWYVDAAGEEVAWRFFSAVEATVAKLARQPDLGRVRHFHNPALQGLRSFRVEPPFDRRLIFYRVTEGGLQLWRLMHGARDLPRRLVEPAEN
jgi:toxin ParE1/3/4